MLIFVKESNNLKNLLSKSKVLFPSHKLRSSLALIDGSNYRILADSQAKEMIHNISSTYTFLFISSVGILFHCVYPWLIDGYNSYLVCFLDLSPSAYFKLHCQLFFQEYFFHQLLPCLNYFSHSGYLLYIFQIP